MSKAEIQPCRIRKGRAGPLMIAAKTHALTGPGAVTKLDSVNQHGHRLVLGHRRDDGRDQPAVTNQATPARWGGWTLTERLLAHPNNRIDELLPHRWKPAA